MLPKGTSQAEREGKKTDRGNPLCLALGNWPAFKDQIQFFFPLPLGRHTINIITAARSAISTLMLGLIG